MHHRKLLILIFTVLLPIVSYANCYEIKDRDIKNYCLAKSKKQFNYCFNINNKDLKYSCLAKIKQEKSYCYKILNKDQKNLCLNNFN